MMRWSRLGFAAGLAAMCAATTATALEQPSLLTDSDLRIGVSMTSEEHAEAAEFCAETVGRIGAAPAMLSQVCDCFPLAWEQRTNRLHRLALPISMAPDSPDSRRKLAIIMRQQGGVHEDRLRQLSAEYQGAAQLAFKACR